MVLRGHSMWLTLMAPIHNSGHRLHDMPRNRRSDWPGKSTRPTATAGGAQSHPPAAAEQRGAAWWEITLVALAILALGVAGDWRTFTAPAHHYPVGIDIMGHLGKVWGMARIVSETWRLPAWFPWWYSAYPAYQYYPPLTLFLLVPVQLVWQNPLRVFQTFLLFSALLRGLGAWALGRYVGGRVCGMVCAFAYAFNPHLIKSLWDGQFASTMLNSLLPWAALVSLRFLHRGTARLWAGCCLTWAMLILTHAQHAAQVAPGLAVVMLVLALQDRRYLPRALAWGCTIAAGLGLSAAWALPGTTPLEMPGVPAMRPGYAAILSADWRIFDPRLRHVWIGIGYYGVSLLAGALAGVVACRGREKRRRLAWAAGWAAGLAMTFGWNIPVFRYIPLSAQMAPIRTLSFAALAGAVLVGLFSAYVASWLGSRSGRLGKALAALATMLVGVSLSADYGPYIFHSGGTWDPTALTVALHQVPHDAQQPFRVGRFGSDVHLPGTEHAYSPLVTGLSILDGWNIEGSPHMSTVIEHNTYLPQGFLGFQMRDWLLWNMRSFLFDRETNPRRHALLDLGFQETWARGGYSLLVSPRPSTYFMDPQGSMLTLGGRGALWTTIAYPWTARGYRTKLSEYPREYLDQFSVIFITEPGWDPRERFEETVRWLVQRGKMVILDLSNSEIDCLFGVTALPVLPESKVVLRPNGDSPYRAQVEIDVSGARAPDRRGVAYYGLDGVWLEYEHDGLPMAVVGYKNVGGGRVYFTGLGLSRAVVATKRRDADAVLLPLFDLGSPRKSLYLPAFPAQDPEWSYSGVTFSYEAETTRPLLISVTYTPRWRATVDGERVRVFNHENLVFLILPPGRHTVKMTYGITWVGLLGWGITILTGAVMLLVCLTWKANLDRLERLLRRLGAFLSGPVFPGRVSGQV